MTSHRDAILGRINRGPADRIDCALALYDHCDVPGINMHTAAHRACEALVAEGLIVRDVSGCYRLPSSVDIQRDPVPEEKPKRARKPRTKPAKFGNLKEAPRLVPIPESK